MIFERREEVFVSVIAGRLEGVVVRTFSTWWRSVALFEEEEDVEGLRVESGEEGAEGRPRARRRRVLSAISIAVGLEMLRVLVCSRVSLD